MAVGTEAVLAVGLERLVSVSSFSSSLESSSCSSSLSSLSSITGHANASLVNLSGFLRGNEGAEAGIKRDKF